MKYPGTLMFVLLPLLSSNAFATAYRCTDAQGNVTYTNTQCQAGTDARTVQDQTSLIDTSKARQYVGQELARAKAKAESLNEAIEPEIAATANQIANLEKLKQADSLIKTALATREQLWTLAVVLIAVAVISRFVVRRRLRKKKNNPPAERDLPIPGSKPVPPAPSEPVTGSIPPPATPGQK